MDFSKLDHHERFAAIAAIVVVIAGVIAAAAYSFYGLSWLAVLASLGLLFVVFQPQIASGTSLPGSKGSLMLLLGGIAGAVMVLALLMTLSIVFVNFGLPDVAFLAAVAGGAAAAWAGWQAFQSEGARFQLGTPTASAGSVPSASASVASTASPAPAAAADHSTDPTSERPGDV